MNVAYLILAHENPGQLRRLISALSEEWTSFYVHIDRKSDIRDFETVASLPRTHMAERRVYVCWGGFSMVQATLNLMQQAISRGYDRYVLLSGADYPVRGNPAIRAFWAKSDLEYISCYPMPGPNDRKALSRLETFRFEGARGPFRAQRVILHQTNRLLQHFKRDYRAVLGNSVPYGGSQWWALSHEAVAHILDYVAAETRFVRFFRHAHIPDEMFFQTILGNSRFEPRIRRNLTYADWSQGITRHPAPLTMAHIERFADPGFEIDDEEGKGPCLFARKFNASDGALLDRLDEIRGACLTDATPRR